MDTESIVFRECGAFGLPPRTFSLHASRRSTEGCSGDRWDSLRIAAYNLEVERAIPLTLPVDFQATLESISGLASDRSI